MKVTSLRQKTRELLARFSLPSIAATTSLRERSIESASPLPSFLADRQIVVVADISESMGEKMPGLLTIHSRLDAAKEASIELVAEALDLNSNTSCGMISFSDLAYPVCQLSQSSTLDVLTRAIEGLKTIQGTNMFAALSAAGDMFAQVPGFNSRREIVLFSDGCNNGENDPCFIANDLKSTGQIIHTVGIGDRESVDEELLKALASLDESGRPRYRFFEKRSALVHHFRNIGGITR